MQREQIGVTLVCLAQKVYSLGSCWLKLANHFSDTVRTATELIFVVLVYRHAALIVCDVDARLLCVNIAQMGSF